MANPKWGTKRQCQSCGVKFYDLVKDPIVCPGCATVFDPEALLKSRRPRPAAKPKVVAPKVEEKVEDQVDGVDSEDDDEEDDSILAVSSDLDDDDDLAEVVVEKPKIDEV